MSGYSLPPNLPRLSSQERIAIRSAVGLWFRVRADASERPGVQSALWQEAANAEHSALLDRILRGLPPLDERPPLSHGYPDYGPPEETRQ